MIIIGGQIVTKPLPGLQGKEREIFLTMQGRATPYYYYSEAELRFELRLRRLLTEAAVALNGSGVQFTGFQTSRSNPRFWIRDQRGGFRLRPDVTPAEGIRNIFAEGKLYAFECATAIVIVLYKGMLDAIGDRLFNERFRDLLLYDWNYDKDLYLTEVKGKEAALPGDVQYFKNPGVSPQFPEWQGENVLRLEENLFYAHGIGIRPEEKILESLNRKRSPGSQVSAYLTDIVVHPDYPALYRSLIGADGSRQAPAGAVRVAIGSRVYTF